MIRSIALPTDFSEEGRLAFDHALALAVVLRSRLNLLHVRDSRDAAKWDKFPHVRDTLERWGLLPPGSGIPDVMDKLGVSVRKVEIRDADASDGLGRFLTDHRPDLMIMATHGRVGLNRWLSGSVSSELAIGSNIPSLLFGPSAKAFVHPESGTMALRDVAVPVDHDPPAGPALSKIENIMDGLDVRISLFHVGSDLPKVTDHSGAKLEVRSMSGAVVETIVSQSAQADLLAMPTTGRHGFLDAIRGSTTERVVHNASCPVLAVPVR